MLTQSKPRAPRMEFHVSRGSRDRYQFDESLFSISGNVVFANFHAARVFAQKMNQRRDLVNFPEQAVRASQINALGLIHEITHYVFRSYRERQNPRVLQEALDWLHTTIGSAAVDAALSRFIDEFPPIAVYRREMTREAYLEGQTGVVPNRQIVLEELLMLWLANTNPAFSTFLELFDDTTLEKETAYSEIISSLHAFFAGRPVAAEGGPNLGAGQNLGVGQNLIDLLRAPALAVPHSLEEQLEYIRERWGLTLGKYVYRLLGSLDLIKEEQKRVFFGPGPVEVPVYEFAGLEVEPEQFSPDRDWMPRLVLIAKNAYVWLDQLSRTYRRPITRLDQVPDEELDTLARWGFTGLWLIGLWERSTASQRIKQLCGNSEAVASAYSLFDYQIAEKLGGDAACQDLRARAWQRGIRLASDMVPNHVGVDGKWLIEHPGWFISASYSPFPSYTFSGPDLSWDERVGIFLEDHYYDRSDAAVVFKRVDRWTGEERYIYHGNDGTSMPWNDTAQLNYLSPEVREAVIQTILHVARQFPIIRFDAAMTLAKKHIQRLWFPEPGTGGSIASRAEFGMSKAQFDALMPNEFWREVVDRAAVEAPDTLLLAEAFWLMEGYFVRTLGMHRVYNSAFMNILRDEDNAKYRTIMKNTLEFDPEILKRYVNFMNNPDERTAVDQFGKGDKYFGICTVMVTMPGLPMFGHGQVEGFTEKYGMEYQRAYWDERPDEYLVQRHEREIFPLLQQRALFAGVEHFLLYDFFTPNGQVDEDVFAYSNRAGEERSLVVYHNKLASIRGWIRTSVAYSVKLGTGDERALVQKTIGEGLGLRQDSGFFCIFRDHLAGLEYIRNSAELFEKGLYIELGAYKCHVFLDFREVQDNDWHQYADLAAYLGGRGVPSIAEALKETFLQPVHQPFKELVNAGMFRRLLDARVMPSDHRPPTTDHRPPTTDHRPTTNDQRPPLHGTLSTPVEGLEQDDLSEAAQLDADGADLDELEAEPALDEAELHEAARLDGDTPRAEDGQPNAELLDEVEQKMVQLLHAIKRFVDGAEDETAPAVESTGGAAEEAATGAAPEAAPDQAAGPEATAEPDPAAAIARSVRSKLETILELPVLERRFPADAPAGCRTAITAVQDNLIDNLAAWGSIFAWAFVHALGRIGDEADPDEQSRSWIDEWLLGRIIAGTLREIGLDEVRAARAVVMIKRFTSHQHWFETQDGEGTYQVLESLLQDREVQQLLRVNRYQGILWFDKDAFERLLWRMLLVAVITIGADPLRPASAAAEQIAACYETVQQLQEAADKAGYQIEKLLDLVHEPVV